MEGFVARESGRVVALLCGNWVVRGGKGEKSRVGIGLGVVCGAAEASCIIFLSLWKQCCGRGTSVWWVCNATVFPFSSLYINV